MSKQNRDISFREQMRRSMADLEAIMSRGDSPLGAGRFTVRSIEVVEPCNYDAVAIRKLRRSLRLSQALFARVLGVSTALVRAWELGTRIPAAVVRRLLDQVRARPDGFISLIRASENSDRGRKGGMVTRTRKVA